MRRVSPPRSEALTLRSSCLGRRRARGAARAADHACDGACAREARRMAWRSSTCDIRMSTGPFVGRSSRQAAHALQAPPQSLFRRQPVELGDGPEYAGIALEQQLHEGAVVARFLVDDALELGRRQEQRSHASFGNCAADRGLTRERGVVAAPEALATDVHRRVAAVRQAPHRAHPAFEHGVQSLGRRSFLDEVTPRSAATARRRSVAASGSVARLESDESIERCTIKLACSAGGSRRRTSGPAAGRLVAWSR